MQSFETLEQEFGRFADYTKEQTVACSSGTSALHLGFEALQLPQGSKVILSDYNMIACARAVTLAGLVPVFVDCTDNLLIDPFQVAKYLEDSGHGRAVRAILATHIYGRSCDMQSLHDLAGKYGLMVVEDLAEAHGVPPHPNTHAACYSFYKNKIIAGEEGGAVCFKEQVHADKAKCLRSLGFTEAHDYFHIPRGHNYRLANCLAKKVLDSLRNYRMNVQMRRNIEEWYDKYCPADWRCTKRDAVWVYDIRIPMLDMENKYKIVEKLNREGIAARHSFQRMTAQQEYREGGLGFTKAAKASIEVLYLPVDPVNTTENCCKKAFDIIRSVI